MSLTPPGLAAFVDVVRSTWNELRVAVVTWAPEVLLSVLLALVYLALFALLRRVAFALVTRFSQELRHVLEPSLHVGLRLGYWMLTLVSVTALFPALQGYGRPIFRVFLILCLLYVVWFALRRVLEASFGRWHLDASLVLLGTNVARVLVVALGLYLVFQQFGIDLLPLLGGLGVAGIALGFAAQDILGNLIAGVTLLLDRPFRIGDWIRVEAWEGQVVRITLRTTRIRTRDNSFVSIPNSKIANNDVANLSEGGPLRVSDTLGVAYATDLDQARQVLLGALAQTQGVLADPPPRVAVDALADSSVNLKLIYWIAQERIAKRPQVQSRVREAAKRALDAAGISIPFPQRVLHLESAAGLEAFLRPEPKSSDQTER
ncbi:small conductance mechanosensitive channel [Deinobacterium chartae]|uniref:Small conductance mechanosensitive channel n=1 Tax=Deinobacterium chartae TaxID=521158 RepID=A0A841HYW2_9DEIO|nr:small conductance mechanosensitive channel [Deinobacterium chartae]